MAKDLKVAVIGDASSYSRALHNAAGDTESFGKSLAHVGKIAALAFGAAGVGAAFITLKRGFSELADAQQKTAQTEAALKSTGNAAHTSSKQILAMAGSLSELSGADDQTIQAGENMLLTFTNIRNETGKNNDIFNQATRTLTDFSFAMNRGAAPSAEQLSKNAILLGKALNDPVKGITALRRVGVAFTDDQKKQIAALVKSGHAMEAQKLILHELNKEFGGSAAAAGKTLPGQLNRLKNSFDNLAAGIVGGLAPALGGALEALNHFVTRLGSAQGLKAKIVVAAQFVWSGLTQGVAVLQKEFSDLLFGSFQKGGGVGPEGIKFDEGLVSKFRDGLAALDWTAVGMAIIDGISNALRTAGDFAKTFAGTVAEGIRGVDWEAVGRIVGPGLATAITVAFVTLTDPAFWAKNWDLALAIGLVAFGGAIGKLAGPIGRLLAKPFGDALLAVSGIIERLSPRLAEAFLVGMERLPGAAARLIGDLESRIASAFGRLGGLVALTIKIIGADIAIQAVEKFAISVAGVFAALGHTISSAFNTAWENLKIAALKAALAIVDPFTHLPGFLGGWAKKAKSAMEGELDKIQFGRVITNLEAQSAKAFAAGGVLGAQITEGVAHGITGQLPTVIRAGLNMVNTLMATLRSSTGFDTGSPSKKTIAVGKDVVEGLRIGLAGFASVMATRGAQFAAPLMAALLKVKTSVVTLLGPSLTQSLATNFAKGLKTLEPVAVKGLNNVGQLIVAAAKKYGVDARAALAVAMGEGGIKFGAVGDSGHAFGPFQFNNAGGVATGKSAAEASAWANSAKGVADAIRMMAEAGAKGKVGLDAITTIIRNFERPLDPTSSIRNAAAAYKTLGPQIATAIASGTGTVKNSLSAQLNALAGLVKEYGPKIGAEHVRGIIAGLVGKTPDIVAAAKAQMEKVVAAMALVAQTRTDLKSAFQSMAQGALAAFDEVASKWTPPSLRKLNEMQREDTINSAVKQVADAQAAVDAAVAAQASLTRNEGESDADFAARVEEAKRNVQTAVEAVGAAQRSYEETQLQLRAEQEQKAHDIQVAADREHLAERLTVLQTELAKHPEEYAKIQRQILKLLKTYHVPLYTAGQKLAQAFSDGLDDGIGSVIATAKKLAAALEAVVQATGGGGGGGNVNPGTAIGGGHGAGVPSSFVAGRASAGSVNVNVYGDVLSEDQLLTKVRTGLNRYATNNAINPLTA